MQKEDNFGEVAALNFRRVAFLAVFVANHSPQAMTGAAGGAAGAAFPLVRAGAADGF